MKHLATAALLTLLTLPAARGDSPEPCRLALALGLDVSGSVDAREYRLQLDGLARALESPELQRVALSAPHAPISLAIFEWGGMDQQRVLLGWTALRTPADLSEIATQLRATSGTYADPATAIGSAILFGVDLLSFRRDCWRRTLDISGDGPANIGRAPDLIPDTLLDGITINGLVVVPNARANTTKNLRNVKTLLDYYQSEVIRGPGAFVEAATDFEDFERAMTRKLIREMQDLTLSQTKAQPVIPAAPLP